MGNGIYDIGLSGLAAAQAGLSTASHNISNANTPGYSRQVVVLGTNTPQFTGSGFIGTGVDVTSVRRIYDDFLGAQATRVQAGASQLDAYSTALAQLDNLFGDAATGLSPALSDFFAAVNALTEHPADTASRQSLLSTAQGLVSRFELQDDQLTGLRTVTNGQVASAVSAINGYAAQIAELNRKIAEVSAGAAQPPNDLLDQRDQLVTELNRQVGATVVVQSDGSYNVFLSNGQGLVVGPSAGTLVVRPNPDDPQNLEVGLQTGASVLRLGSQTLTGGALGGLLAFRDGPLADAQDALGRIAVNLATAFNDQHRLGVDLTGSFGGDFFTVPAPVVVDSIANTGNATIAATIQSAPALVASDYRLSYDGSNYTLTRLADGNAQTFAALPQTVDGVTFAVSGTPAAGDRFLIQPVRHAAGELEVAISDPARIAAAGPVVTGISVANVGTATIGPAAVDSAYVASPLSSALTLTYASGSGTLSGFPPSAPVTVTIGAASTAYAPGTPVPYSAGATIAFGGMSFAISGTPANGDAFTVGPNTGGSGDNRNAQRLAGLADRNIVANGTSTFAGAYGQLVAAVGNETQQAQIEHGAQAALLDQTKQAQQTLSGVNLDEEAANLTRYQQAYQAAGKTLAIAGTLFDAILDIVK